MTKIDMHPAIKAIYIYAAHKDNTLSYVDGEFIIDIGMKNRYNAIKCSIKIIDNKFYKRVIER